MNKTGKSKPKKCHILGCSRTHVVGGHVIKDTDAVNLYILPICSSCNSSRNTAWMNMKSHANPVMVNKAVAGKQRQCQRQ